MMIGYNRVAKLAAPKLQLFLMRHSCLKKSTTSTLGIMRERHNMWERRAPLSPGQVNPSSVVDALIKAYHLHVDSYRRI